MYYSMKPELPDEKRGFVSRGFQMRLNADSEINTVELTGHTFVSNLLRLSEDNAPPVCL